MCNKKSTRISKRRVDIFANVMDGSTYYVHIGTWSVYDGGRYIKRKLNYLNLKIFKSNNSVTYTENGNWKTKTMVLCLCTASCSMFIRHPQLQISCESLPKASM